MKLWILFLLTSLGSGSLFAQFHQEDLPCNKARGYNRVQLESARFALADERLNYYDVSFYFINLEADNLSTHLTGTVTIKARVTNSEMNEIVLELAGELIVESALLDGSSVSVTQENDLVIVGSEISIPPGDFFTLTLQYSGTPPIDAGFFAGISHGTTEFGTDVTWTLSEPFNASDWFPVKQVLEDKADSAYIYITVPKGLKAGASGRLINVREMDNNKVRYEWQTHYPIAYYLLSMAISDYREYNSEVTIDGTTFPVINYIYNDDHSLELYKDHLDRIPDLLTFFSGKFGPYPFSAEKYGHCMAPLGGGMEHQTMTTLQLFNFTLEAHEMAHQWFGDNVTCATFRDIWMNEGFARFSEYLALESFYSRENADDWMEGEYNRVLAIPGGSVYISEDDPSADRIFDFRLTYSKGGILLHMLRYLINDDPVFFETLMNFQQTFTGRTASAADFRDFVSASTGIPLDNFFEEWYYGEGYPTYSLDWVQEGDQLTLTLSQESSVPDVTPLFTIPVPLRITTDLETTDIRLEPDAPSIQRTVAINGNVQSILIDPENLILNKSNLPVTGNETIVPILKLYPNPSEAGIMVHLHTNQPGRLTLYSGNGQLIGKYNIKEGRHQLPVDRLSAGLYIVFFNSGNQLIRQKLVIR